MSTGVTKRGKSWRAEAYDRAAGKRIYKTFPTEAAAKAWRLDTRALIARGDAGVGSAALIRDAWAQWLAAARSGVVRARGGAEYKPGVLRSYEQLWNARLLDEFGHYRVTDLRRVGVQRFVDRLVGEGLSAQTVRNYVTALRVLFKWCIREDLIQANPCDGVDLPAGGVARDRIASPSEAVELLAALTSSQDRAIYATAFFSGLRRGELMGLRCEDVDLQARTISVRRNYDPTTRQFVAPKSKAGARSLGIPELLVPYLKEAGRAWKGEGLQAAALCFPSPRGAPFVDSAVRSRVLAAWSAARLKGIGLHEARHTYASLMIAAGVNIKTISEWMGHSSVNITLDRYGHLLPGSAAAALGLLNDYLQKELA